MSTECSKLGEKVKKFCVRSRLSFISRIYCFVVALVSFFENFFTDSFQLRTPGPTLIPDKFPIPLHTHTQHLYRKIFIASSPDIIEIAWLKPKPKPGLSGPNFTSKDNISPQSLIILFATFCPIEGNSGYII